MLIKLLLMPLELDFYLYRGKYDLAQKICSGSLNNSGLTLTKATPIVPNDKTPIGSSAWNTAFMLIVHLILIDNYGEMLTGRSCVCTSKTSKRLLILQLTVCGIPMLLISMEIQCGSGVRIYIIYLLKYS